MDQLHGFKLLSNIFLSFSTLYDVFFANFIILDLDPQEMNADPQPWFWHRGVRILKLSIRTEYFVKIEKFFYENILAYMRFWRFSLEKEKKIRLKILVALSNEELEEWQLDSVWVTIEWARRVHRILVAAVLPCRSSWWCGSWTRWPCPPAPGAGGCFGSPVLPSLLGL